MYKGFVADPGDRYTGGRAYRLAQLLARQNVNNGTNAGGLAHVGNQLMQAFLLKRDMDAAEKDKADQAAVGPAMIKGMNAKPWVNPDTGDQTIMDPASGKMVPTAPAGGMPGALASLSDLSDNPYAGKLAQQLLVSKAQSEDQLRNAKELRMSPQWQGDPELVRQYNFARTEAGGSFPGTYQDFVSQVSATKQGPTAPMQNFGAYNDIVKQFGENSPQANLFRQFVRANQWQDRGDAKVLPDPGNPGQNLAVIPKQLAPEDRPETKAAQKAATVTAESQAKSAIDLPKVEAQAQGMLDLLTKVENHPGFSTVVGAPGLTGIPAKMGLPIPGTEAADFTVLLDQIKGKQFLEAFETLKGGGQITEVEGRKATEAMARMNTAQSEKEFRAALQEFKGIVQQGANRAKAKAAPQYNRRAADPKPGGMTFLGFE